MWRRRTVLPLACLVMASFVPPAQAQVFVDPDSPTGREYDIPLERARRDASSTPSSGEPYRSRTAPLFGEGIDGPPQDESTAPMAQSSGDGTGGGSTGRDRERDEPATKRSAQRRRPVPPTVQAAVQQPGAPARDGRTTLLIGLVGLLVVGLGAAGGMVLRRSRR